MVKLLVKKQLQELFRGFFVDRKKNRARSRVGVILSALGFVVLMVGVLGGIFTALCLSLAAPLAASDLGWLYFAIMSLLGIFLGVFGSVFNTYSGLYLAKDNDLLLSLPIPPRAIIVSRLLTVYLMGLMYSAVVMLPAVVVWWISAGASVSNVIGGLLLVLLVSAFVLLLSCLLGWVVAKVSLRLKNRSFAVVLLSLLFLGLYYFVYFKAQSIIQDLIANAMTYGESIRRSAYAVYLIGRVGEGDWLAIAVVTAVVAVLTAITWALLSRTFLGIATATAATAKKAYREKPLRRQSLNRALLSKELRRFGSNANYMLNCGFATVLLPIAAIALLLRGGMLSAVMDEVFGAIPGALPVLLCTAVCLLASMNDMATPSVSLEGKSLWLLQSLPVKPWAALRAKLSAQLWLTVPPALLCSVCSAAVIRASAMEWLALLLLPLFYCVAMAALGLTLGTLRANVHWTNEITPIKQSLAIMFVLFAGWILAAVPAAYLLLWDRISFALWIALIALVYLVLSVLLIAWLKTSGARRFAALH